MALIGVLSVQGTAMAFAQPVAQVTLQKKCTSTPCGNTATGEDPSDIAERHDENLLNDLRETATDRQRWGISSLYSNG